jgi:hypothetical protein
LTLKRFATGMLRSCLKRERGDFDCNRIRKLGAAKKLAKNLRSILLHVIESASSFLSFSEIDKSFQ